MHLDDLKKMAKRSWTYEWDQRDHEQAINRNNPWSLEWFFACRNNNPVPPPPNNNPTEIDALIERVREAQTRIQRCEDCAISAEDHWTALNSPPSTAERGVPMAATATLRTNRFPIMPKSPTSQLQDALRKAMGESSRDLSEKASLEAALDVADEWKMRLEELEAEEDDE